MQAPMNTLPMFTSEGLLPDGDFPLTLEQLEESLLVHGPNTGAQTNWDASWRRSLIRNLGIMARQLWAVGVDEIFVDGSFVEDKAHPNDIDGYFVCDAKRFASGELGRDLNLIDPKKCWTWEPSARRAYRGYAKKQLPMWHAYRVDLYPHYQGVTAGKDAHGQILEFPAFFRKTRDSGQKKGIVRLVKDLT